MKNGEDQHRRRQGDRNSAAQPAVEAGALLLVLLDLVQSRLYQLLGRLAERNGIERVEAFLRLLQGDGADSTALAVLFDVLVLLGSEDVVVVVINVIEDVVEALG